MYSRISGTGSHLPDRVLANPDSLLKERTGIATRHIVSEGETTLDLAEAAGRKALSSAGVPADQVDLMIIGSRTPDNVFPNLGCMLQDRLGISACPAFSLEASSSGFLYALSVANQFVVAGQANAALVIGADTLSRLSEATVPAHGATLFADGAGAVVLEPSETAGLLSCRIGLTAAARDADAHTFAQVTAEEDLPQALAELEHIVRDDLAAINLRIDDIDWLVPHQANRAIIARTVSTLGISMDRAILTLTEHGNTGSASLPVALDVAAKDGRIARGDVLLLETIGGGSNWGSAIIRY